MLVGGHGSNAACLQTHKKTISIYHTYVAVVQGVLSPSIRSSMLHPAGASVPAQGSHRSNGGATPTLHGQSPCLGPLGIVNSHLRGNWWERETIYAALFVTGSTVRILEQRYRDGNL